MNHYFAIEGNDCAGKNTLTKGVIEYIKREKLFPEYKIKTVSFPDYESNSGKLITKFLNGEYLNDKPNSSSGLIRKAIAIGTLYADNRKEWFDKHFDPNEDNVIYIFDRYMVSNLTHQMVPVMRFFRDIEKHTDIIMEANMLNAVSIFNDTVGEYETVANKLPKAHYIIIDVAAKTSIERMKKRAEGKHSGKDILESEPYIKDVAYFIQEYISYFLSEEYCSPEVENFFCDERHPGIVLLNDDSRDNMTKASPEEIVSYMQWVIRQEKYNNKER